MEKLNPLKMVKKKVSLVGEKKKIKVNN